MLMRRGSHTQHALVREFQRLSKGEISPRNIARAEKVLSLKSSIARKGIHAEETHCNGATVSGQEGTPFDSRSRRNSRYSACRVTPNSGTTGSLRSI